MLAGCATPNRITRVDDSNAIVVYTDESGYEDRFSNIYDGFKAYPVTCTNDCYPASADIECESDMQNCQFVGNNPKVNSNTAVSYTHLTLPTNREV